MNASYLKPTTDLLWRIGFEINKSLYLYLPRGLGGEENINQIDVCSRALNIQSALFLTETGWLICDQHLQNKLTGRTMFSIVLLSLLATILVWKGIRGFCQREPIQRQYQPPLAPPQPIILYMYTETDGGGKPKGILLEQGKSKITVLSPHTTRRRSKGTIPV